MTIREIILEELDDIPTTNQTFHYTNGEALSKILKSGYLKGNSDYPAKVSAKKYVPEISTMRPTKENELNAIKKTNPGAFEKKMENISLNIGRIKIILFKDRITASVRGAKFRTIAELPKNEMNRIEDSKKRLVKHFESRGYKEIKIDLEKFINTKDLLSQARELGRLETKYKQNGLMSEFRQINRDLKNLKGFLKPEEREGEERIVFNDKKDNLPLNKKIMRIELLRGSLPEISPYVGYDFIKNFKKYDSLFVKNEVYNKLMFLFNKELKYNSKTYAEL